MKLRILTDSGIAAFANYLLSLRADPKLPIPVSLLTEPGMSEPLPTPAKVEPREFPSRFAAAEYLYKVLSNSNIPDIDKNRGLWSWLTLYYLDQLCPTNKRGDRSPGENARYIPELGNFRKFYRHLLAAPYRIYRLHKNDPSVATGLLNNPVNTPGELYEQIASRQELISNKLFLQVVNMLYIDTASNTIKKGITSDKGGAPRRLADVLGQFELTFDLISVSSNNMIGLLPKEFNKFRN